MHQYFAAILSSLSSVCSLEVINDRFENILQESLFCYDLLDGKMMEMRTPYGTDFVFSSILVLN